jgi:hypothetical protein
MKCSAFLLVFLSCVFFGCQHDPSPIDKSLVLDLPLNGDDKDYSRYAASGIVDSASFTFDMNSRSNDAGLFDSTQSYIRVPNSTVLDTLRGISLCALIKPVSFEGIGNNAIITKGASSFANPYYQYHLGIVGNKYPTARPSSFIFAVSISGQYVYVVASANSWTPGNWYEVVGTYDRDSLKLFVNGTEKVSLFAPGTIDHFGKDVFIGKTEGYTNPYDSKNSNTPATIDEVRIYSRALSIQEIKSFKVSQ